MPLLRSFAEYIATSARRSSVRAVDAVGRAQRDAEGEVHLEADRLDRDRVGDAGPDAAGDLEGLLLVDVEDDHRELVAAEAGHAVARPDAGSAGAGRSARAASRPPGARACR